MLKNRDINKRHSLNIIEAICLIIAVYFVCYLLRQDNILPISINAVWLHISHWAKHFKVLAVGLLPIYVALMVFGTAIIGIRLGSALQRWLRKILR